MDKEAKGKLIKLLLFLITFVFFAVSARGDLDFWGRENLFKIWVALILILFIGSTIIDHLIGTSIKYPLKEKLISLKNGKKIYIVIEVIVFILLLYWAYKLSANRYF